MPELVSINNTFFTSLLNRLGVKPPPVNGFDLLTTVQPVSLVDADISIPTTVTPPLYSQPATAGLQTAPAANVVLADTGPLNVGTYTFVLWISHGGFGAVRQWGLEHRNAANNANVWLFNYMNTVASENYQLSWRETVAQNERIRVETLNIFGAGELIQALIWPLATG